MLSKVLDTIEKYSMLQKGDTIVLGLSGGADSVSLLYILLALKEKFDLKIIAVHINHGLRGAESDEDERFVEKLCTEKGLPVRIFSFDLKKEAKEMKLTEEEAGRKLRYDCFHKVSNECNGNKIAVAHNKNDSAETVLMRIFRGTGTKGLCGISPVRNKIIRPLIGIEREEIESFCAENKIPYRTDSTNGETKYIRNKIRLKVIPLLKQEFNPKIIASICKMSELLHDDEEYLQHTARNIYNQIVILNEEKLIINIDELKKLELPIKRRVLRICLTKFTIDLHDITNDHVMMIIMLLDKNTGKKINLPNSITVQRNYDNLTIYKEHEKTRDFCHEMLYNKLCYIDEIQKYIFLGFNKGYFEPKKICIFRAAIDFDKIIGQLVVRNRRVGDKVYLEKISGTKKIKDYFIDNKIPRLERDRIPILADRENAIMIIDHKKIMSDFYKKSDHTKKTIWIEIWEDTTDERGNQSINRSISH